MSTAKDPRGIGALRVVECGQGVSAAFGAKMIADLGAEVIKVEPPGGDLDAPSRTVPRRPGRSRKERAVRLPQHQQARRDGRPCHARGTRVASAVCSAKADILIHNVPPYERANAGPRQRGAVREASRARSSTSISMFGDRGPRANWRGYELNASNAGGWAFLSPGASPYPDLPPLKPFGAQCDFHGGALRRADLARRLSPQAAHGQGPGDRRLRAGGDRGDARDELHALDLRRARDLAARLARCSVRGSSPTAPTARSSCSTVEEDQWQSLVELMGNPEWAQRGDLQGSRLARGQNMDALKALMTDWLSRVEGRRPLPRGAGVAGSRSPPVNTHGADVRERAPAGAQILRRRSISRASGKLHAPGRAVAVRKDPRGRCGVRRRGSASIREEILRRRCRASDAERRACAARPGSDAEQRRAVPLARASAFWTSPGRGRGRSARRSSRTSAPR